MVHIAQALAEVGALRAFVAPFAAPSSALDKSTLHRLGPVGNAVLSQRRRRVVSEEVARLHRPAARVADVAATVALRLRWHPMLASWLSDWRAATIQRGVAGVLQRGDTDVMAPAGAALKSLQRGRDLGIRGWLDCPTAHHEYAERLLREENRLEPRFAETMQFPAHSIRAAENLDKEIEAADALIVLSSFQQRTFEEAGVDPGRLRLAPLGVDAEMFRPEPRIGDPRFTVGFVGQVTQRKGVSYLLSAFQAMRVRDARLLVVGHPVGPREAWLRPGVEHRSPVARAALSGVYAEMDVFVMPSLIEGFGLTALEAMACGLPVIVSENTFGADIIEDGVNGFVVPIRDPYAIQERIEWLYADGELRRSMGANARSTAAQYTWANYGRRVVDLTLGPSSQGVN